MKICILSFTGLNTDGKDATRILKEMRSLTNAGYKVKAIGLRLSKDFPHNEFYYGVEINRIKPMLSFDRKLQRELPKGGFIGNVKRIYTLTIKNTFASGLALFKAAWKENADIYHCFGIYSLVTGFFLKILKRKKVIYDAVEVPHQNIISISSLGFFARPLARTVGFSELLMASGMDHILTVPSAGDKYLKRFRRWNKKVVVLRNAPFLDWNGVSDPGLFDIHGRQKVLLYMGAFTRSKGILKMLEVFNIVRVNFPPVRLVLVGSFDEIKAFDNVREETMNYIQNYNLQDSVVITDHISWQEIPKYLGAADIALHLYQPLSVLIESQGSSSFFEYMAASLPIICSDFPTLEAIIDKYDCGVAVDPTNEHEIANAILKLLTSSELAQKLGRNARRAFEQEFNWGVEEKKLLQVYSELERSSKNE